MTTDTPAAELRAAASLLREAAGHATPGPWRTHDTHLGAVGGHTATVLTDRPNINDTELIAWLPTMSHEPWDEARNAWRNAGWMALMDPTVGLALADWLDSWTGVDLSEHGPMPEDAQHALAVARRILGTTEQADTETALTDESCRRFVPDTPRAPGLCASCGDARGWHSRLAAEAQQPETHACDNCDGIDPDTCLTNPRPATAPAVDRATVLRERADFFEGVLRGAADPGSDPRYWSAISDVVMGLRHLADEQPDTVAAPDADRIRRAVCEAAALFDGDLYVTQMFGHEVAARLRRLADEAQQPTDGEPPYPAEVQWIAEQHDGSCWEFLASGADRGYVEGRLTSYRTRFPEQLTTRLIRKTATYTVEQPAPAVTEEAK